MLREIEKQVSEIINTVDPFGLIDSDTPESFGEYKAEVKAIAERIKKNLPYSDFEKQIVDIFIEFFEDRSPERMKDYKKVAKLLREKKVL